MNLYFTLHLSVYSPVLGYFWLSRLKPKKNKKNHKNHKKPKNQKTKFLILKNHWFFPPLPKSQTAYVPKDAMLSSHDVSPTF